MAPTKKSMVELTWFDGHLTRPTLRAEVFNEQGTKGRQALVPQA